MQIFKLLCLCYVFINIFLIFVLKCATFFSAIRLIQQCVQRSTYLTNLHYVTQLHNSTITAHVH